MPPTYDREHENLKPDRPPRAATEPEGAEGSAVGRKTKTDPQTGAPNPEHQGHSET